MSDGPSITMRPFAVVFGLVSAFVLLCGLAAREELPRRPSDDQTEALEEPLRKLRFTASLRRDNFMTLGLSGEMADETAELAKRYMKNKQRFEKMLEDQAADVGIAFCPEPSQLPSIYGAMRFLVGEERNVRFVIDPDNELIRFNEQPWFATSGSVRPVYDALETRKDRRRDATLMGIAAILTRREQEAINLEGPWSNSAFLGGSFDTVVDSNRSVEQKAKEYLAIAHILSEIANRPDGICDTELL